LACQVYFGFRACTICSATCAAAPANDSMVTNDTPDEKPLQHASFVVHATRGLIRDQKMRRRVMVVVLTVAVVLMICGTTVLRPILNPHQRPGWFVFYWLVCAWLTVTAILIAIFDLLMVTAGARKAERELREKTEQDRTSANR
jgi:hypothetical protein